MTRGYLVLCMLLVLTGDAAAHLLPKQNATVNIVDRAAYCTVATPISAYAGVDDDGDGLLSAVELARHTPDIQRQFEARFRIRDRGREAASMFSWASPVSTDDGLATDYVVILHRVNFDVVPRSPVVTTDLFGDGAGEQQMVVTMSRGLGKDIELAILTPGSTSHQFYRGAFAILGDFIRIGAVHIWSGLDHLLFLLTILVGAAGWRHWVRVVTSFTIAHSLTLTLSALDVVRLPAAIVEPAIAASIVVVALVNLRAAARHEGEAGAARFAVVFACGLLHGCGFASAIGTIGLDTSRRIVTLAGFNIGIELGQFVFVGGLLLLLAALARVGSATWVTRLPRHASVGAAVAGAVLLVQRLAA